MWWTGSAAPYRLVYPANLGAGGFQHPVVTWGNGTFATPDNYPGVLQQLASWGFVVVAFARDTTQSGLEMLAGAELMVAANANPSSPFYQHIDTDSIGALGHSQGAGGAVNATTKSDGLITTVVPIALTRPLLVDPEGQFDLSAVEVPAFFLGGGLDILVAPPFTIRNAYDEVSGPAAVAILRGADHLTIQNSGGRFLGYLTAWLMYQLQDDPYARAAFVGQPPEINTNSAWRDQAERDLT
jgi:pimeloyl-ACP methyl ester carboxylesterase